MRRDTLHRVQRILLAIGLIALLGIVLSLSRVAGYRLPGLDGLARQGFILQAFNQQVALISGHAGYDSGAVCTDEAGNVTLTEAEVNARIARLVAQRLRSAGADVVILDEYDWRLDGLRARVFLSLHADSCIDASGYKVAHRADSPIPVAEDRLLACIHQHYPAATGIPYHSNSITYDMTHYHAFNRLDSRTPGAILEMGFLGGDQAMLTQQPETVAKAIADSLLCFMQDPAPDD